MAEKKKKKKNEKEESGNGKWYEGLKEETRHSIWGIIFLGFSLFLLLSIFDKAGMAGSYISSTLELLFGRAVFFAPLVSFFAAISLFTAYRPNLLISSLIGAFLVFVSSLGLVEIIFSEKTAGYVGFLAALPFLRLIDFWASLILFFVLLSIGFLIMFNVPVSFSFLKRKVKDEEDGASLVLEEQEEIEEETTEEPASKTSASGKVLAENEESEESFSPELFGTKKPKRPKNFSGLPAQAGLDYKPVPLELLEVDKGKPSAGDIKANANLIKRTLQNFGIEVVMDEIRIGPSVTQYALKPAEGVKLSKILSLNNDLALALAAHPIRIEAPIPGKSLVGIEVPNRSSSIVGLRHLLKEMDLQDNDKPLMLALGRNVAGRPVSSSLAKMPHLLIAGATGSGKSVAIHSLMMSLLCRNAPWELKFLLIDPKRVELNVYNKLPYLLSPVVTEAKKAIIALKWATKEMESRYQTLMNVGARDICSYHQKDKNGNMPFIVIVIDELADIMATYPREFESSIVRLAQMSRAVGIHLVVSTQRPSVEVITGLIKANITSRIAFQVASQVDSRTILDMGGAERLLGNGDMLYLSGDSAKPRRIQGSFVSEKEVKNVVDYLIEEYEDLALDEAILANADGEVKQGSIFDEALEKDEDEDDLYEEARELVLDAGKASASYLQRRLRVGYARAARLLDMLEEKGVVGPADGARPREVLVSKEAEGF